MILLKSVFNWDLDLQLPRYGEVDFWEYVFCFIILNIALFNAYRYRKSKPVKIGSWVWVLIFCLYPFWDTDYFSFAQNFYLGLEEFRDPLYQYLKLFSFNSYTIFRFYIWGTAILLYYKLTKRFNLCLNTSCFIFTFFFLTTFCYGRVSLGMALYFWGLSFLMKSGHNNLYKIVFTLFFFILAFFAHRSISLLIALTPIIFFKFTVKRLMAVIIGSLFFILVLRNVLVTYLISNVTSDSQIGAAAAQYMSYTSEISYNWKFYLMSTAHQVSFILLGAYVGFLLIKRSIKGIVYPKWIWQIYVLTLITLAIGVSLWLMPGFGLEIMGYRIMYLTGIPLCLVTAYMISNHIMSKRLLWLILAVALMYSEGFIFGKIITLS